MKDFKKFSLLEEHQTIATDNTTMEETKQTPGPWKISHVFPWIIITPKGSIECINKDYAELIAQAPDLLDKVSEQQKEIERLREIFRRLLVHCTKTNNFNQYDGILGEIKFALKDGSNSSQVSEQSQRIQQLEGLLKRTLEYDFEPRHPDHPVYKLIAEIKAALNP